MTRWLSIAFMSRRTTGCAPRTTASPRSAEDYRRTTNDQRRATELAEFKNPQQEPGMERRLLLVFALTFLVIMLFQPVLKRYLPQPPAKPESSQAIPPPNAAQPAVPASAMNTAPAAGSEKRTPAVAPQQASSESETVVEND